MGANQDSVLNSSVPAVEKLLNLALAAILANIARLGEIGIVFARSMGQLVVIGAQFVENLFIHAMYSFQPESVFRIGQTHQPTCLPDHYYNVLPREGAAYLGLL